MGQKKITDLSLVSAFVDGLSFPVDDGIITTRATAAQVKAYILAAQNIELSMLDLDIFTGLTSVAAADDDYFPLVDTSDSNKTKKATVGTFVRALYRSVSSYPATITTSDGTLLLSGSAGTITLPANGTPGKRYRLVHNGTNFVGYTLATTGGATIGPNAIASGSFKMWTKGEMIELEDDGTNWQQVGRNTSTGWIDCGVITFGATTTAPTKANTGITVDKVRMRREGTDGIFNFEYQQSSATGAAVGSGDYKILVPQSLSIDTTLIAAYTTTIGNAAVAKTTNEVGAGTVVWSGNISPVQLSVFDANYIRAFANTTNALGGAWCHTSNAAFTNASLGFHGNIRAPILYWQP